MGVRGWSGGRCRCVVRVLALSPSHAEQPRHFARGDQRVERRHRRWWGVRRGSDETHCCSSSWRHCARSRSTTSSTGGRAGSGATASRRSTSVPILAPRAGLPRASGWCAARHLALAVAYYLPFPNVVIYASCGISGMPFLTFLIGDIIGTLLWKRCCRTRLVDWPPSCPRHQGDQPLLADHHDRPRRSDHCGQRPTPAPGYDCRLNCLKNARSTPSR